MAQNKITWYAKAGLNVSNWTSGDDTKNKIGYRIGGGMDYAFTKTWSLQPSLYFSAKGTKISGDILEQTVNQMYLVLPVMAAARFHIADYTNIVVSAGPYAAYGIAGKTKRTVSDSAEEKISTFGDYGVKRFDAGLAAGVALEFGQLILGVEGQLGLVKVLDFGTSKPKNINIAITLGYLF